MFGYCIQIDVNIKIVIVYKAADILSPLSIGGIFAVFRNLPAGRQISAAGLGERYGQRLGKEGLIQEA